MEQGNYTNHFLFVPEIITPAQYYDAQRNQESPLQRLMLAVLMDAIRCFQTGIMAKSKVRQQVFREAQHWLFDEDSAGLFSFEAVCEFLAIPPRLLRTGLRRWQFQQRTGLRTRRLIRRPLPSRFRIIKPGSSQIPTRSTSSRVTSSARRS